MTDQAIESTVSLAYLNGLVQYVKEQNINVESLLDSTALKESDFSDKNGRVDAATYFLLFKQAVTLTADPLAGLKVGGRVLPGNYGVIGYVLMACRTFSEVLVRSGRYQKLVGDIGYSDITIHGDEAEVRWHSNYEEVPPAAVEEHVASIFTYSRWITGQDKHPLQITFQHSAQGPLDVYEAFFQCDVLFDQSTTGVRFPIAYMDIELPQYDLDMCTWLDQKAQKALEDLEAESQFIGQVKKIIRNALPDGVPKLDEVSLVLGKSEKNLQRDLGQYNTNFKKMVDDTRYQLALGYIGNDNIELNELAFLLGFSEQSAFQRAFKRWTGISPGKYRKQLA